MIVTEYAHRTPYLNAEEQSSMAGNGQNPGWGISCDEQSGDVDVSGLQWRQQVSDILVTDAVRPSR
jgi:hypothetical protein